MLIWSINTELHMDSRKTVFCPKCNKDVSFHYPKVNHLTQLLITVISCGLWLPMWIASYFPSKTCDECDSVIWEE